jgi:hypothetical protein
VRKRRLGVDLGQRGGTRGEHKYLFFPERFFTLLFFFFLSSPPPSLSLSSATTTLRYCLVLVMGNNKVVLCCEVQQQPTASAKNIYIFNIAFSAFAFGFGLRPLALAA